MREGYIIRSFIAKDDIFLLVNNYKDSNLSFNIGARSKKTLNILKDENSIGVWKIKSK
jgi:hypothetical protein